MTYSVAPKVMFGQEPKVHFVAHSLAAMTKAALEAFAARLHELCDDLHIPSKRGRESSFARLFLVTSNAARKWLRAEGMPELSRAIEICARADVSVLWLLQGTAPKRAKAMQAEAAAIAEVLTQLPAETRADVVEFLRYKIDRSTPVIAGEKRAEYLSALDAAGRSAKATDGF